MENNRQITKAQPGAEPFNPFAHVQKYENINQGTVAIEEQRAIAEAQGRIIVAKRFPRDAAAAFERIMVSCKRKKLAESAMYSFPRGGQVVTGPSIRLAEELARAWGNIEYGIRELSQKEGISEMEAYCWDVETNVISSQRFSVKHERHTKSGVTRLTDPRDIYELTANNAGRRLRARILAVLPPDLVDAAVEECYKTLSGNNDEPIEDRIKKMLKAFATYGINKDHIEGRLGKKLDQVLPEELVELQTIYTAIRDGIARSTDYFGGSDNQAPAPAPVAELNQKVAAKKAKPAAQPTNDSPKNEAVQLDKSVKVPTPSNVAVVPDSPSGEVANPSVDNGAEDLL